MREGAGASGGEAQHLKAVRQRAGMAALAAIFDVVMDRVVVGRDGLEGRKISLGDGAARDIEALATTRSSKNRLSGKRCRRRSKPSLSAM
jgi:hypothetical protein